VELAFRRHVDQDIGQDGGGAAEPPAIGQAALLRVVSLDLASRAQMVGLRDDGELGELTAADGDLAAAAETAASANGIDVDAKATRRGQQ